MANFSEVGRPRRNSLESRTKSSKNSDFGSFKVTHADVPASNNQRARAKSFGTISEFLNGDDKNNLMSKFLGSKLSSSAESVSTKSTSSEIVGVIYEEDEEVEEVQREENLKGPKI